jgi:nitroimidazol reductase NimA-like FMN-containing flavoprotein (pyridoxamine 5'-phosphate oxidase superfamily)
MSEDSPVEMDPEAVDEFLGTGGTGVLSLSESGEAETPPHSVPVSYGYDAAERVFYFRLAVGPDSGKGEVTDRPVTFVTYRDEDSWESVVARGDLEAIEEAAAPTEALAGLGRVDIPLVDAFDSPVRHVDFAFVRLDPDDLTGRREFYRPE